MRLLMIRILPLLAALMTAGCVAPKSYLDPQFRGVKYQDIRAPLEPIPVQLTVVGELNGKVHQRASKSWRAYVEKVLASSRVFVVDNASTNASVAIRINNVADIRNAAGKGFMTGFTFGAVGTAVTDGYIMTAQYTRKGGDVFESTHRHAIHSFLGNAKPPAGISLMPLADAPPLVAEDMVLHFLKELERCGAFDREHPP
jgi:hypothetical protein